MIFLIVWSGGYVAAKFGLAFTEPFTFLVLRFGFIVVIMFILFFIFKLPLPKNRMEWIHLIIVGLLLQSLYFSMCYMAYETDLAVGTLALILSLQPIIIGLIAPSWTNEKVGWQQWSGLILGLLGAIIVIVSRLEIATSTTLSFIFGFLALFGITAGSLWEKRFGVSHHPITANLVGYTAGLIGVMPFMFLQETIHVNWTWEFIIALAYLIIGSSLIGVGLLLAMIRAGDVSRVSALFFLVPPLTSIIAWFILGEVMPPMSWLGMILAAIGVFIATHRVKTAT